MSLNETHVIQCMAHDICGSYLIKEKQGHTFLYPLVCTLPWGMFYCWGTYREQNFNFSNYNPKIMYLTWSESKCASGVSYLENLYDLGSGIILLNWNIFIIQPNEWIFPIIPWHYHLSTQKLLTHGILNHHYHKLPTDASVNKSILIVSWKEVFHTFGGWHLHQAEVQKSV